MHVKWQLICVVGVLWASHTTSATSNSNTSATTTPSPTLSTTNSVSQADVTTLASVTRETRQSAAGTEMKSQTASPDCKIITKEMTVPVGSARSGKVKMECKVCRAKGYQEECIYVNRREGAASVSHPMKYHATPMMPQASQKSESIDYDMNPFRSEGKTTKYMPTFASAYDEPTHKYEGSESRGHDDEDSSSSEEAKTSMSDFEKRLAEVMAGAEKIERADAKAVYGDDYYEGGSSEKARSSVMGEDDPMNFSPMHIIPKEYMQDEYDPKYYEKHDEAANEFHNHYPLKSQTSSAAGDDESEEVQDSRASQQSVLTVLPSMDILKSYLPDVKPLDVDRDVKPKKIKKQVEYEETVRYNSDDDKDKTSGESSDDHPSKATPSGNPPPESFFNTDWLKGHATNAYPGHAAEHGFSTNHHPWTSRYTQPGGQASHGYPSHYSSSQGNHQNHQDQYAPRMKMDSKDCKVEYRDSASGHGKEKCVVCGGSGPKGFSEECSMDYNQPTKQHEMYYNKQHSDHDPYAARQMVYGQGNNKNNNNNHHGSSSNHGDHHHHHPHGSGSDSYDSHDDYSPKSHSHHYEDYSPKSHSHDHEDYSPKSHSHNYEDYHPKSHSHNHDDYSPKSHSHDNDDHHHSSHSEPRYTGVQSSVDHAQRHAHDAEKDIAAYFGHKTMKFAPFPHDDPYGKGGSASNDHFAYMPKEEYYLHYFPSYERKSQ